MSASLQGKLYIVTVLFQGSRSDLDARIANDGYPITDRDISDIHYSVFDENGLPPEAWTGSFF
ncbi:MAG: hypothetical protein WCE43_07280, partial [Burkholderiales bacterium]